MNRGSRLATIHLSIPQELKRWINASGVSASTLFTALLYIMKDADVVVRGRNVEAARRAIYQAVLRSLGLNVTDEKLDEIISRRKRLFIGEY